MYRIVSLGLALVLLSVSPLLAATLRVSWTASTAGSAAGAPDPVVAYRLYRCDAATCPAPDTANAAWTEAVAYAPAAACAASPCSGEVTQADPAPGEVTAVSYFLVAAAQSGTTSPPSNVVRATVTGSVVPPSPPGDLQVVQVVITATGDLRVAPTTAAVPAGTAVTLVVAADER